MGKSIDFSEGIRLINAAHSDSVAILQKWKDLIDAPGEVTLHIKGVAEPVTLPSIREAISRYLGGTFAKITLNDGANSVTISLDESGKVILENADSTPANFSAANIAASRISPKTGTGISIIGNTTLSGGTVAEANIRSLSAYSCEIYGANFPGSVVISGSATITGSAYMRNATVERLNMGVVKYRKQVLKWGVEAIVDEELNGHVSGGIWAGDPAILERAGIFPEPTWVDCIYVPHAFAAADTIGVYFGESGDVLINNQGMQFQPCYAAMWPYKMYEQVEGGYRIRWLPLEGMEGRVTYLRSADIGSGIGTVVPALCTHLRVGRTGSTTTADARDWIMPSAYACRRRLADIDTETVSGVNVSNYRLFAT